MTYVAANPEEFIDQSVGDGHCVAYIKAAALVPHTGLWKRGKPVAGTLDLPCGTAIATFDDNGRYGNRSDGNSHAAIYLGQNEVGIQVLDQWVTMRHGHNRAVRRIRRSVQQRTIFFQSKPIKAGDGRNYYVVE